MSSYQVQEVRGLREMDGESGNDNTLHLKSTSFSGKANEGSHVPEDEPAQHFVFSDGRSGSRIDAIPLPQWIETPKFGHNSVESLIEHSRFLSKATTVDMLETIPSTVSGIQAVVSGVSDIENGILCNFGKAPASEPVGSYLGMDASKVWLLRPHDEGEPVNKSTSIQYQIHAKNSCNDDSSWTQELTGEKNNASQLDTGLVTAPGLLSKSQHSVSRKGAMATDRIRRLRIGERINALQKLLPHSTEGGQASVLDDIIDYVKYLQLQIKDFSRSRLGGESSTEPFIFLEAMSGNSHISGGLQGYGHYIRQQMLNEPLEEMMGKLLEENPLAAAQLLERKGLFVLPVDWAEGLCQAL